MRCGNVESTVGSESPDIAVETPMMHLAAKPRHRRARLLINEAGTTDQTQRVCQVDRASIGQMQRPVNLSTTCR